MTAEAPAPVVAMDGGKTAPTGELGEAGAVAEAGEETVGAAAEREVLTWDGFGDASRELALRVAGSGYRPDLVIAIARGGLLLAGSLAYALGTKSCGSLNVEFYTGVDQRLPEPVLLPPMLDAPALEGRRVLLVDDVSDSGRTLAMVVDLLAGMAAEVRSVTLYTKPRTVLAPDFTWRETDRWIDFPWSSQPVVQAQDHEDAPGS